jgi:hypothetical protein
MRNWRRGSRSSAFFSLQALRWQATGTSIVPRRDTFRVLGPLEVAYIDFTGSGAETAAHLRENGRIVLMFCAFEGEPRIVRLHGRGELVTLDDPGFAQLASHFPPHAGARAVVRVEVSRVSSSCGYSVPVMEFRERRDKLDRWTDSKGPEKLEAYRAAKNSKSIDGLPAFTQRS